MPGFNERAVPASIHIPSSWSPYLLRKRRHAR